MESRLRIRLLTAARNFSTKATKSNRLARERLLNQIYAPLNAAGRGTLAQDRMKSSGECWSEWHKPDDIDRFASLQEQSRDILEEIDRLKAVTPMDSNPLVVIKIVDEYSHQSVKLEQNSLLLGDSRTIAANLEKKLLQDEMFPRSRVAPALRTSRLVK